MNFYNWRRNIMTQSNFKKTSNQKQKIAESQTTKLVTRPIYLGMSVFLRTVSFPHYGS